MAVFDVKAEIGGVVWKIEKAIGDAVAEDDSIMILESMKMEIPVLSPKAGVIKEIKVKLAGKGEQTCKGS